MKTTIILTTTTFLLLLVGLQFALGDNDGEKRFGNTFKRSPDVASVNNQAYINECGSCHMAYPPGLLPKRSWKKLMNGLEDHFEDNAELEADVETEISQYLFNNSADNSDYRRSRKIMRTLAFDETPLRITEIAYIRREHNKIPTAMIKHNNKVVSLSNCTACHQNADKGSFSERDISIPGYAGWED
ncbi:MAG: hypothetical protein GXP19_09950 [Gammaproteobacteria bacterium]|nr:hypothetical protein [Gammaproteobacteria bacterium]